MELEIEADHKNISYLQARDPSILAWNFPKLKDVRKHLDSQLVERTENNSTELERHVSKEAGTLQVYLRIKKPENLEELYEIRNDNTLVCNVPHGTQSIRNIRDEVALKKLFKFSKIFGPDTDQASIFNNIIKEKILNFINGFNYSLLTYGASGSGKTFTIIGTADAPGVVPRALEYLFRTLPPLPERPEIKPKPGGGIIRLNSNDWKFEKRLRHTFLTQYCTKDDYELHTRTYKIMQERLSKETVAVITDNISDVSLSVWVSFAEIYNEYVYDLLTSEPTRGQQRQKLRIGDHNGNAYIKNLTYVNVLSGLEAYHILQYGLTKLKYASTSINDHSSRSHCIFTIKLAQASDTKDGVSVSSFNFCDLAGSERMKNTNNFGERLKESNNINTSLLVLGRCVSLVRDAQRGNDYKRMIPFRESKLTQLFQKALLGQEAIAMIVNINPSRKMFDESQHVLNFSAIAKDVIVEEQQEVKRPPANRNKHSSANRMTRVITEAIPQESEVIMELQDHIEMLESRIEQMQLDHNEDREHVIDTYKKILKNNVDYWEKRCKDNEEQLAEYRKCIYKLERQQSEEKMEEVINLDSSSDEEEDTNNKREADTSFIIALQKELAETKLELQKEKMRVCQLTQELEAACLEFKRVQRQSVNLCVESMKLKEENDELKEYVDMRLQAQLVNSASSEECVNKETSEPQSQDGAVNILNETSGDSFNPCVEHSENDCDSEDLNLEAKENSI